MPPDQTPQLQAIRDLSIVVLAIAAVIFAAVEGLLLCAVWRFRDRGERTAAAFTGDARLEVAWTLVPLAVVVSVFAMSLGTMRAFSSAARP